VVPHPTHSWIIRSRVIFNPVVMFSLVINSLR
jgi:hypothetical protein